jgi:hypothetical protein
VAAVVKRSLNDATPPPRGTSSSSWPDTDKCSRLAHGDLRAAGTGTGLNKGETAGDLIGFLVEPRDGGGGGGARLFESELGKVFRSSRCFGIDLSGLVVLS